MKELEFDSIYDLYERVLPALKSKVKELRKLNILYIKEKDIFEYLANKSWNKSTSLYLNEIVDDIITLNNNEIDNYVQNKIIEKEEEKWN